MTERTQFTKFFEDLEKLCEDSGCTNPELVNGLLHGAFASADIQYGDEARKLMTFILREMAELAARQRGMK